MSSEADVSDEEWEDPRPPVGEEGESHSLEDSSAEEEPPPAPPNLMARRRGVLSKPKRPQMPLSPQQKLLLLDTWQRSGLLARDFAALVNLSRHTLYAWKKRFEELGPAGLMDKPRGAKRGSRLPELTKRSILMLKTAHPDWGCQRISDMLLRGPALPASPSAVARVLREAGYEMDERASDNLLIGQPPLTSGIDNRLDMGASHSSRMRHRSVVLARMGHIHPCSFQSPGPACLAVDAVPRVGREQASDE